MKNNNRSIRGCEIVTNLMNDDKILFDMDNMKKVLIERSCIQEYSYIIHDQDIYTELDEQKNPNHKAGALKSPHIHLILRFKRNQPQHLKNVAQWFGIKENFIEKFKSSWRDACVYQVHANAPEKFQYSPKDVVCNFDYQKLLDDWNNNNDLDTILQRILDGEIREYNKTLEIDHMMLVHHSRKIEEAFKIRQEYLETTQQERHTECIFITGCSGVGKTTLAKKIALEHNYSFYVSSGSNDIMDGYLQQDCLIIDEVRPSSLGLSDLLKLLDPHTASSIKSRYKNKYLNCKLVILTTVLDIDTFYNNVFTEHSEPITQLKRRCTIYIRIHREQLWVYMWDKKAMQYADPLVFKNTVLDEFSPNIEQTPERIKEHIAELIPFLEPYESEFHLSPAYPEITSATKNETISDTVFYKLMEQ